MKRKEKSLTMDTPTSSSPHRLEHDETLTLLHGYPQPHTTFLYIIDRTCLLYIILHTHTYTLSLDDLHDTHLPVICNFTEEKKKKNLIRLLLPFLLPSGGTVRCCFAGLAFHSLSACFVLILFPPSFLSSFLLVGSNNP